MRRDHDADLRWIFRQHLWLFGLSGTFAVAVLLFGVSGALAIAP